MSNQKFHPVPLTNTQEINIVFLPSFNDKLFAEPRVRKNPNDKAIQFYLNAHNTPKRKHYTV